MVYDSIKNFSLSFLTAGISAEAVSLIIRSGDTGKFPDVPFNALIWKSAIYAEPQDDPNMEIVRVTSKDSNTFTITRAQEDTTAHVHETNDRIEITITTKTVQDIRDGKTELSKILTPENLSSQCNGSNLVFTTANSISKLTWVSLNGALLIEGLDLTFSGNEITLSCSAPANGEKLYVLYIKT